MSTDFLDILISLLAMAAAIGLSLYPALLVPATLGALGLIELPEALAGLATPPVWGMLTGLLLIEWLTARYRTSDLAWSLLHTLVKPQAAVLLVSTGLSAAALSAQWGVAFAALALTLVVHMSVLGMRAAAHTAGPYTKPALITTIQWSLAAGLSFLAISAPPFAAAATVMLVLAPLPWLPSVWGAAYLPLASAFDALSRAGHPRRWDSGAERLPTRLRQAVEAQIGAPLRAAKSTRATLARLGSQRPYIRGRLIVEAESAPFFAHRRGLRPAVIPLGRGSSAGDGGLLVETVETSAPVPYTLCLGPEAPPLSAVLAVLAGSEPAGGQDRQPGHSGPESG